MRLKRMIGFTMLLLTLAGVLPATAQTVDPQTVSFTEACSGITAENLAPSDLCKQVMALNPTPTYKQVPLDSQTLNNYAFWKVTGESPDVFASPGGAITRNLGSGFNFVRTTDTTNPDWIQIEGGEWMRRADLTLTQPSVHRGLLIDDDLANPFAWVLGNVFTAPYPGGPQSIETGVRMWRYNLVNIFAAVEHEGWRWYMVGPDQWIEQRMVSKVQPVARPDGVRGHWIAVDLYEQSLVAYEDDTPVFATVIASGLPEWETNEGLFEVWYRVPDGSMSGSFGAPDAYALQSVPWTLYYDGDISIHGTYWHDGFGFRRSHGCVNVSISDSRWLYEWTLSADGPYNEDDQLVNNVYVYHSEAYR